MPPSAINSSRILCHKKQWELQQHYHMKLRRVLQITRTILKCFLVNNGAD